MTTIAWDGVTLATDSQGNIGDQKAGDHIRKMWKNIGPFQAVALSGELRSFDIVLDAMRMNEPSDMLPQVEVQGVCVDDVGQAWEFEGHHWSFKKMKPRTAQGSGWALATAAMEGGADAVKALRITCKLDLYSGGRIQKHSIG